MTLPSKLKKEDDGSELMFPNLNQALTCNYVSIGENGSPAVLGTATITEDKSGSTLKAIISFNQTPSIPNIIFDTFEPSSESILNFSLVRTIDQQSFENITYIAFSITSGGGHMSAIFAFSLLSGVWTQRDIQASLMDNQGDFLSFPKIVADNCRFVDNQLISQGTLQLVVTGLSPRIGGGYNIFICDNWVGDGSSLVFKNLVSSDMDVPPEFINNPVKDIGITKTNKFNMYLNGIPQEHVFINEIIPVGCEGAINSFKGKIFTDGGVYSFFVNGTAFTETPSIFRDNIFKDYLSTLGVILNAYDESGNIVEMDVNGRYDTATTAEFINNSSEYVTFEIGIEDASAPDEFLPPINGSAEYDNAAGILTFCLAPAP